MKKKTGSNLVHLSIFFLFLEYINKYLLQKSLKLMSSCDIDSPLGESIIGNTQINWERRAGPPAVTEEESLYFTIKEKSDPRMRRIKNILIIYLEVNIRQEFK